MWPHRRASHCGGRSQPKTPTRGDCPATRRRSERPRQRRRQRRRQHGWSCCRRSCARLCESLTKPSTPLPPCLPLWCDCVAVVWWCWCCSAWCSLGGTCRCAGTNWPNHGPLTLLRCTRSRIVHRTGLGLRTPRLHLPQLRVPRRVRQRVTCTPPALLLPMRQSKWAKPGRRCKRARAGWRGTGHG